ncbi:7c505771-e97e-4f02-a350-22fccfb4d9cb [Sclerotinia trifoliorum]|uniref:histone acetyltransferase n=1 Tax=Sclerotinia trifoliorum TaxID=28548 RepID=A0A8H2W2P5_9HELO|nr:7c505771-e97e-4f02-a350-22fccfb4d9cb [Sclerotinia trifoliorum]
MDSKAITEEKNGVIKFQTVKNDGSEKSFITLTGFQEIIRETLRSMSPAYIAKSVLDPTHTSLVMIKKIEEKQSNKSSKGKNGGIPQQIDKVIGGICYRVWGEKRNFVEMVYLVISTKYHGGGYGSHLVNHFKDEIKSSYAERVMEVLAYADLTAIGFFKKQGFTRDITLDESIWVGVIKDYVESSLMQCTLLPKIRYVEAARMIRKQKETLLAKIAAAKRNEVVHPPPAQWARGSIKPIDPYSIPGIRESGWSPAMDAFARENKPRPHSNSLRDFLFHLTRSKQAWPFLEPVDGDLVPDYYATITHPMDLQTMGQKLDKGLYDTPKSFVDDVKLIIKNCRQYNRPGTVYCKRANSLERLMLAFIKDMPEWSDLL